MIYVIEGPDGTGKSTLAAAIAKKVDGQVLHLTFNNKWQGEIYHRVFIKMAHDLDEAGTPVILDRWVPSEYVYGKVFRKGERFDTNRMIKSYGDRIVWIYCRNDNAVENHLKNKALRNEMFNSMEKIAPAFDEYIAQSPLNWHIFDYTKISINKFIKEIL